MSTKLDDSFQEAEVGMPPVTRFCENGVQFYPPAYRQRYGDVCDILKNDKRWAGNIHKVVDFGCAELSLLTFLKSIPNISTILEVDFDKDLLQRSHELAKPLFYDHLFPRKTPLTVSVLAGSVADPDYRLTGCDAVLCIEIIEHLDPWAFDRMPHNIFGFIRPRLAFVTTPNADFNVLFPGMKEGDFRHWDHRFEWTREEFKDWADNVVVRYPDYTVEMIGIAPGPKGTEHLGCCSQMALFINQNYVKQQDVYIAANSETENIEERQISDNEGKLNCDNLKKEIQIDETAQCLPIVEGKTPRSQPDSEEEEFTNNNESAVVRWDHFSFYERKQQTTTAETDGTRVQPQWDCRVWENPGVCQHYTSVMEYVYPFECDPRTREQKVVDEAMFRAVGFSYCYDAHYDDVNDRWSIPLHLLLDRMTNINIELDELRSILSAAEYDIQDDNLIYVKPQLRSSSASEASLEEYNAACEADNTFNFAEAGDSNYIQPDWNAGDDEDHSWASQNYEDTTSSPHQPVIDIQEIIADRFADDDVENQTLDSGLLGDSTTSVPDDRSRPDSPLAQFLDANRDASEEQRLSDSGYLKSQDSPQSPVCSDSFSNDLITPDKDVSEMMVPSTILECIPENLNCPTSCCSPKEQTTELPSESRRPSIGPQVNNHLRHNDFEVLPQNNDHLRHNDVMPQNNHLLRHNDFEVHQRLVRPVFLQIQNFEVAVVDHLNNNVDFEGNNFGADQRERGDAEAEVEAERVHLLEVDFVDHADNLLLGQLDRHNENHILDELLHQHQPHQQDLPQLEQEEGIIMEAVLEYRENFQGNENDDLNLGALVDIPLDSQDTLPNTPLRDEGDEDSSLETNYLLESIAKTLGLNSQHSFYTEDSFPNCSFQLTKECNLKSPKYHKVSKFHQNEASLENFKQANSFHKNECDLTNIVKENDSFFNNLEQGSSSPIETDGNPLKEGQPFFERASFCWPFFHDMVKDNINMERGMSDKAILQKKLPNLTGTDSDESALAESSEPNQMLSRFKLNDEGSSETLDVTQTVWSST